MIALANRLSTICRMDRIVVVKDGRIVEEGSHDARGNNRELWNLKSTTLLPESPRQTALLQFSAQP